MPEIGKLLYSRLHPGARRRRLRRLTAALVVGTLVSVLLGVAIWFFNRV